MQFINEYKLSKRVKPLLLALIASTALVLGGSSASARTVNLSDNHTYSDLYASILFSNGKGTTIDQVDLTYDQIASYGDVEGDGQRYGALSEGNNETAEGKKLARMLATLNKYQYLITRKKEASLSDPSTWSFSNAYNTVTQGTADAFTRGATGFALNGAAFGAKLFDAGNKILDKIGEAITGIDIPAALGLRQNKYNLPNELGGDLTVGSNADNKGALGKFVAWLLEIVGIDAAGLAVVRSVFVIVLLGGLLISLIVATGTGRFAGSRTKIARVFLRVFVMMGAVTLSGIIQESINDITNMATNDQKAPAMYSQSIVLDSLSFAATKNLNLGVTGKSPSGGKDEPSSPYTSYRPTNENISAISQSVNSALKEAGIIDNASEDNGVSLVSAYTNQEKATVNDYYSLLQAMKRSSAVAATYSLKQGDIVNAGAKYNEKNYNTKFDNPYFLIDQQDLNKLEETQTTNMVDALKAVTDGASGNDAGTDTKTDNDKNPDDEEKDSDKYRIFAFNGMQMAYNDTTPFRFVKVKWDNVESYVYGSSLSNSETTADFHNYTNGAGTVQNDNPTNGDTSFDNLDDVQKKKKKDWKRAMWTNSLMIAASNRFNGIRDEGGASSFSTQSTAFILQSALTKGGVTYQGYNTTFSSQDKGKPNSTAGATFMRYSIPHSSGGDLTAKQSILSSTWIIAGVAAVLAIFYMLKAPLIATVWRMISNFFQAFIFGDIISLLAYLVYYTAIVSSFAFARIGMLFSATLGNAILSSLPKWISNIGQNISYNDPTKLIGGIGTAVSAVAKSEPATLDTLSIANLALAAGYAFLLTWPMFDLYLGGRGRNKVMRVGIMGLVCMQPYILAEAIDEWLDRWRTKLYGVGRSQSFFHKLSNQVKTVDQKEVIKDQSTKLLKTATTGATVGAALLPGGAGITAAAKMGAKSLGKRMLGNAVNAFGGNQQAGDALDGVEYYDETGTGSLRRGGHINSAVSKLDNIMNRESEMSGISDMHGYTREELEEIRRNDPDYYEELRNEYYAQFRQSDEENVSNVSDREERRSESIAEHEREAEQNAVDATNNLAEAQADSSEKITETIKTQSEIEHEQLDEIFDRNLQRERLNYAEETVPVSAEFGDLDESALAELENQAITLPVVFDEEGRQITDVDEMRQAAADGRLYNSANVEEREAITADEIADKTARILYHADGTPISQEEIDQDIDVNAVYHRDDAGQLVQLEPEEAEQLINVSRKVNDAKLEFEREAQKADAEQQDVDVVARENLRFERGQVGERADSNLDDIEISRNAKLNASSAKVDDVKADNVKADKASASIASPASSKASAVDSAKIVRAIEDSAIKNTAGQKSLAEVMNKQSQGVKVATPTAKSTSTSTTNSKETTVQSERVVTNSTATVESHEQVVQAGNQASGQSVNTEIKQSTVQNVTPQIKAGEFKAAVASAGTPVTAAFDPKSSAALANAIKSDANFAKFNQNAQEVSQKRDQVLKKRETISERIKQIDSSREKIVNSISNTEKQLMRETNTTNIREAIQTARTSGSDSAKSMAGSYVNARQSLKDFDSKEMPRRDRLEKAHKASDEDFSKLNKAVTQAFAKQSAAMSRISANNHAKETFAQNRPLASAVKDAVQASPITKAAKAVEDRELRNSLKKGDLPEVEAAKRAHAASKGVVAGGATALAGAAGVGGAVTASLGAAAIDNMLGTNFQDKLGQKIAEQTGKANSQFSSADHKPETIRQVPINNDSVKANTAKLQKSLDKMNKSIEIQNDLMRDNIDAVDDLNNRLNRD